MKSKIFTFFTFLLFTAVGVAQPLSDSQKPDTIVFNYRSKPSERLLIKYNTEKTKLKTVKQTWDSLTNDFKFSLDTTFTYYPNSKVSGFTTSDDYTANYYYHSNNTDSLRLIYYKDKLLQRTTYNSDGNLTSYKTWIIVADTLQSQGGNYYFYNQNGKIQKAETSFFLNGKKASNSEFNYEYDNMARLVFTNRRQKNFTIADTTWKWIQKAEYKYLDEDDKYDEVLSYQSNVNGWYATGKTVFIYTPLENKILSYNASNVLNRQGTISFNENGQIVVSKNELLSNQIWVIGSQDDYFYRSDGSLSVHQSRLQQNGSLNLEIERIYGYKTPDISDNDDLFFGENLSIYPNPSSQTIHVNELGNNIHSIRIIDMKGSLIHYKETSSEDLMIERNGAPSGLYYLQIQTDKGTVTKPIIWQD